MNLNRSISANCGIFCALIINRYRSNIRWIWFVVRYDSMPTIIGQNSTSIIHHQQTTWIMQSYRNTGSVGRPSYRRDVLRQWRVPIDGSILVEVVCDNTLIRSVVSNRVCIPLRREINGIGHRSTSRYIPRPCFIERVSFDQPSSYCVVIHS